MRGAAVVYSGLILAFIGLVLLIPRRTRKRGLAMIAIGIALAVTGFVLPAPESRVTRVESRLDELMPAWQFNEVHTAHVNASPEKVYEAIKQVRADEILLFRTLTWIRRGGRDAPESILNPGDAPLLDVATRNGFEYVADEPPREVVVRTALGPRTVAMMNFAVRPDGKGGSHVSTETRVFASSDRARRRFARYWRVIYPGSALIRRMWLRAIERRAATPAP
jgi:hypothetical protein